MAIALPSLIGGLLAGMGVQALFVYVALNTGLALWAKHRNKKKDPAQESPPSTRSDTENALGQSLQVIFGMADLGGQVFDVINREDGGYPVFGGIGYVFPKDFSAGVDLVDRETGFVYEAKTGEDADDKLLTSYSKITRDSDSGTAVSNQTEIRKSLKFGNDARKTINNVFLKFFNQGGFSQDGDVIEVLIDQVSTSVAAITKKDGIRFDGSFSGRLAYAGYSALGGTGRYTYSVDFNSSSPVLPSRDPSLWDMLRITSPTGQTYLVDITGVEETLTDDVYTFDQGWPLTTEDDKWVLSSSTPVTGKWDISTNTDITNWIQLSGAKIELLLIDGAVARQSDTFFQHAYPEYRQNNSFAWLAQEVRDPGNTNTNVTTGMVSAAGLLVDESMPACNSTPITSQGGLNFFQLVTAAHSTERHLNPYAIIYEFLVNGSFGLGWDPDKLDIDSFIDCFDRCMANDPNIGNERAWKFGGYVMADQKPAKEYLEDILNHIHGDYVWTKDGKLKVFLWDGSVPSTPKRINMRNVLRNIEGVNGPGELMFKINTRDTNDMFNELNVRFFRPDKEFVPDYYLRITDYGDTYFSGCTKPKNMDLLGFYEPRYARKSALLHMARNQKETEFYETEVDMAALDIEAGDIVLLEAFDRASDNANAQTQYLAINSVTTWSADLVLLFSLNEEFLLRDSIQVQGLPSGTTNVTAVTFTGVNTAVLSTAGNPVALGAAVGDLFSLYDTDTFELRKYIITALTTSSISTYLRPIEVRPGDRARGDKVTFGAETLLIEDTGFDESGNFYIRLAGDFASSPLDQKVTLTRLAGIKMLDDDKYARVVEVKAARDLKTALTLQLYDVTAYGGANFTDYTITAPTYSYQNFADQVPPKPEFVLFTVDTVAGAGGSAPYVANVSVRVLPDPRVDRVVVTLYAATKLTEGFGTNVGTKTLERGGGEFQIPLNNARMFLTNSAAERLTFRATAIAYNRNNLASDTAFSEEDLGATTLLEAPVIYPADVEFDTSRSYYRNTLLITSKKYNDPSCSGLELRKTDANWGVIQGGTADSNLLLRGSQQIVFEQTENLPVDSRDFTTYLKAFNAVGLYSATAASLTLTDYAPAAILDSKITAAEMGPVVKLTVVGFDDGVGASGVLYPLDVRSYKFHISTDDITYAFAGESSRPEYLHTLASEDFGTSDTVTRYFKCVAWDRLTTETESDDKLLSVSGKSVTFRKLNTVDMQLETLLNELTDNLFRLGDWGYSSINTEAQVDFAGGETYVQVRGLEADTDYVVSWDVISGSPALDVTGDITPLVTIDGTTKSAKFRTLTGEDKEVTFTMTSVAVASVRRMRLTEGKLAKRYTLHPDDRPIAGTAKQALDYVTNQMLETLDNMNVLLTDADQMKTEIIQKADEIRLKVAGNDILTQIILNEQGIYFGGRELVFDGNAVFLNSAGVVWGKITNISGSTIQFNIGPCQLPTAGTTFRQDFTGAQGLPIGSFTISSLSRDPDTGVFTATVATGTPQLGMFIDQNITTTTIDGGKITTESIVADKIAAGTIGANKLLAKEIQTNFLQLVGTNNIVISPEDGILVFNTSAVASGSALTPVSTTSVTLASGHGAVTNDFIKFDNGNNQGVFRKLTVSGDTASFDAVAVMFDGATTTGTLFKKTGTAYMSINIVSGKPTIHMGNSTTTTKISTDGIELGAGTKLDVGTGTNSLHFDVDGNLWLGASTFASAPFKVSKAGELTAETGTFKGALNIGSGAFAVSSAGVVTAASIELTQVIETVNYVSFGAGLLEPTNYDSSGVPKTDHLAGQIIFPCSNPSKTASIGASDAFPVADGSGDGYANGKQNDTFVIPAGASCLAGSFIKAFNAVSGSSTIENRFYLYLGAFSLATGSDTTVTFKDSPVYGSNQIESILNSAGEIQTTYWTLVNSQYLREVYLSATASAGGSNGGTVVSVTPSELTVTFYERQLQLDGLALTRTPFASVVLTSQLLGPWSSPPPSITFGLSKILPLKSSGSLSDLNDFPLDSPFEVEATLVVKSASPGADYITVQPFNVSVMLELITRTNKVGSA